MGVSHSRMAIRTAAMLKDGRDDQSRTADPRLVVALDPSEFNCSFMEAGGSWRRPGVASPHLLAHLNHDFQINSSIAFALESGTPPPRFTRLIDVAL